MTPLWVRCAALGLATGSRASAPLTALTWTAHRRDPSWLTHPVTKTLASAMSAGESVGDQLPSTPSRLEPAGLAPRLILGGLAGVLLAQRYRGPVSSRALSSRALSSRAPWSSAAVGVAGAAAGAFGGARFRALAAAKLGSDHPGAVVEDAVVVGLGAYATR